jgi:hypothetical protein
MLVIRAACFTRLVCALVASSLAMAGCSSMHRVPNTVATSALSGRHVSVGDDVRVTMNDGRRVEFAVQSVNDEAIVARDGTRYERTDVLTIERRAFDLRKTAIRTAAWFGAIVGASFLLVILGVAPLHS